MEEQGTRHGGRPELGRGGGGADLISALPEDLLLQVLVRLRCAGAAARTSLVSPRWRGLWTRLPDLNFRDVALGSLLPALASLQAAAVDAPGQAGVCILDIRIPTVTIRSPLQIGPEQFRDHVSSLLHAAAGLSPVVLRFAVRQEMVLYAQVHVPRFHRATSIELHGLDLVFTDPPGSWLGFPALESLTISDCQVKLADLLLRSPRLRVLRMSNATDRLGIIIQSASLHELDMETNSSTYRVDIEAPALKQLALSFSTRRRIRVSIFAPMLEKVSWRCRYTTVAAGIGRWGLLAVRLESAERNVQEVLTHIPHVHVLSLSACAHSSFSYPTEINIEAELSFATEIEKHMVTDFSVLELYLARRGHVFGAFVSRLLGMHRICTATWALLIVLPKSEDKEECPVNCPCDEPRNWRSQTISFNNLEIVEIRGFEGEDHEFDFLKLLFRSVKMLKIMTVQPSDEVTTNNDRCTKIYDIFNRYPSVECNIDISPGSTHSSLSGAAA